jgi:predicted lipoprotein
MKTWIKKNLSSRALQRLAKLALIFVVAENILLPSAPAQSVAREAVLRDLARDVIAAGYQDLAAKCQALTNAAGQLAQTPDQVSLDQARLAWAGVADAANRVRCFQAGPIVDREYAATFYYAKISPPIIDGQLQESNVIDQAYVAELGGNVKGMFALEYLLFGHKGYPGIETPNAPLVLEMLSGKNSQRRRTYLLAVARDMEAKAGRLTQDWTSSGEQGAAAKFVAGGQATVNLLVNQLAHAIEDAEQARLNFVLVLPKPISGQLYRIEASPSGNSLQGVVAYLEGMQKLYRGAGGLGVADALKQVNAPLAKRVDEHFDDAISATKSIGEPLEQAVVDKRDAVQNACDKVHALEILFKVDLASALGVTISFTSGDGD